MTLSFPSASLPVPDRCNCEVSPFLCVLHGNLLLALPRKMEWQELWSPHPLLRAFHPGKAMSAHGWPCSYFLRAPTVPLQSPPSTRGGFSTVPGNYWCPSERLITKRISKASRLLLAWDVSLTFSLVRKGVSRSMSVAQGPTPSPGQAPRLEVAIKEKHFLENEICNWSATMFCLPKMGHHY